MRKSLIIRLKPFGRTHAKEYRIVLAQKYRAVNKIAIETLGYYNPTKKITKLETERVKELVGQGVELSNTVANIFSKNGIK